MQRPLHVSLRVSPGAMALGSIQDDSESSSTPGADVPKSSLDFTEAVYTAQAAELDILGVNWAFAPVGDVNSERENPVIGVRSFGDGLYFVLPPPLDSGSNYCQIQDE